MIKAPNRYVHGRCLRLSYAHRVHSRRATQKKTKKGKKIKPLHNFCGKCISASVCMHNLPRQIWQIYKQYAIAFNKLIFRHLFSTPNTNRQIQNVCAFFTRFFSLSPLHGYDTCQFLFNYFFLLVVLLPCVRLKFYCCFSITLVLFSISFT